MRKSLALALLLALAAPALPGCGRRKLPPDAIERNRIFAEILLRSDRRQLGEDGFFPEHLLESRHPIVREWCAVALGRIGDPRALPWLYEALRQPRAPVRAAAAFAVGEIEDREMLRLDVRPADTRAGPELVRLLDDPAWDVRMRAVEALGKAGGPADAAEIIARVRSSVRSLDHAGSPVQRAWLGLAVTALMRLNDPEAVPVLLEVAGMPDPEIQWRAVNALYRMRRAEGCSLFRRLLSNRHTDLRAHAARALGVCPDAAADLHPLLEATDEAGVEIPLAVRVSALQGLVMIRDRESAVAIVAALGRSRISEQDPDAVNFAIQAAAALGNIAAPEGAAALRPLLPGPEPVANSAVIALAKILKDDPARFMEATSGISLDSAARRRAWAQALGELGGPAAVAGLERLLAESRRDRQGGADDLVLPSILAALAKAGAPDLHRITEPFLRSRDGVVVRAAAAAYRPAPGDPEPWRPILGAWEGLAEETGDQARVEVLNRLEPWVQSAPVQGALRRALEDRSRNARIAAARLLRRGGAPDVSFDHGPAETRITEIAAEAIAHSRRDRTVAILETARGTIEIELFREDAPLTVHNFVSLARGGYYDGLTFMRVVPWFVIQGGDPRNDQEGGPGYTIRCEINRRPFERGSVGMALAGKDTGGSQFFIAMSPQPHLDGGYTCFGRVVSGMEAVDRMTPGDRILSIRVVEDVTWIDYRRF